MRSEIVRKARLKNGNATRCDFSDCPGKSRTFVWTVEDEKVMMACKRCFAKSKVKSDTGLKISLKQMGRVSPRKGVKLLESTKKAISRHNKEYYRTHQNPNTGKPAPWAKNLPQQFKKGEMKGEKNVNWKGGITGWQKLLRGSPEYKFWREAVFARDNWACIWCGQRGGRLQADHIKPFAYYPELRFAIDNGRTLCKPCHLKTDTWGRKYKPESSKNP